MCSQLPRISSYGEWLGTAEFFGFVFGALAGCGVIPLDWNRPWQAFPIPNVISGLSIMALTVALGPWIFEKLRERAGYAPVSRGISSKPIIIVALYILEGRRGSTSKKQAAAPSEKTPLIEKAKSEAASKAAKKSPVRVSKKEQPAVAAKKEIKQPALRISSKSASKQPTVQVASPARARASAKHGKSPQRTASPAVAQRSSRR